MFKKTGIQMYDKKHAFKHTYKCMIKTGIQMYDKKKAYKCMIKTHTNV